MDKKERIAILQQIDLFQSFDALELGSFAQAITEVEIDPETTLVEEGAPGLDMFILLEGALKIYKDNRTITTITPVDYIGEMALIEEKPRSATVISSCHSKLLKITSDQFDTYFSRQPKSLVSMMKSLSRRIRNDTELIANEFEKANILIHDMRNSTTAFLLLDLIEEDSQNPEHIKFLNILKKTRTDLAEMMEEALANAKRLQFNKLMSTNSLQELIEDLTKSLSIHANLKNIIFDMDLDQTIPKIPFHKVDIRRVLTNLLINAGQASQAGGTIKINLYPKNDHAVIEITDQGYGIAENNLKKVFLPHFTTKEKGNGLGLASCKQIVEEKHGGKLTFRSESSKGTTFSFTLPYQPMLST